MNGAEFFARVVLACLAIIVPAVVLAWYSTRGMRAAQHDPHARPYGDVPATDHMERS